MNLTRLMTDKMWIEGLDGVRRGPYKTKFGGHAILVFQPELSVTEHDRIIQSLPDGSEQGYRIEGASSNAQRGHIPAHISIRIVKDDTPPAVAEMSAAVETEDARRISLALAMLSQAIEAAGLPDEQRSEARHLLRALTETRVIKTLLGNGAAGA